VCASGFQSKYGVVEFLNSIVAQETTSVTFIFMNNLMWSTLKEQ
jgi:hypothetical protein